MSVRARRRACASESGGLNRATSTANLWTTVKAARWCRNAISALGYMASLLTSVRRAVRGLCGRSGFGVIPGGGFQRFEAAFKVGTELSVHVQEHSHDLQRHRLLPAAGNSDHRRGTRGRMLILRRPGAAAVEISNEREHPLSRCRNGNGALDQQHVGSLRGEDE